MLYNFVALSTILVALNADCYLHYFRGSNNRLNEASANRNNANRLFDSQNNNRGGYNCCDLDTEEGFEESTWMASASEMYDWRFLYEDEGDDTAMNPLEKQYEEIYFVDSTVSITWTNQHGTGNKKLLSQMILQYGCDNFERPMMAGADGAGPAAVISSINTLADGTSCGSSCKNDLVNLRKHGLRMELMNGGNTETPDDPDSISDIGAEYTDNNGAYKGRHESEEWYYLCETRSQNWGLFHADQDLNGESQIYTRQNNNGNRRGLECPEERDYYPWWHPTPWHDIAIITPEIDYCENFLAPMSQNVHAYSGCVNGGASAGDDSAFDWFPEPQYVSYNLNQTKCEMMGGSWESFGWDGDEDQIKAGVHKPECVESYWTKVNYLGNVDGSVRGGKQAHYDWTLPSWTELRDTHKCWPYQMDIDESPYSDNDYDTTVDCVRMVFRIRYNMSTMDYDPYKTNSTHDYHPEDGILSPIEENPEVDVGFYVQGLQLAINTAQTGRTFQDRSHTFLVCNNNAGRAFYNKEIINVNVRGKRGNIVQTFPATEYDFEPQHIELSYTDTNTCLHFQWCGSNTHNNGSPGGDGQTGDAGEGTGGTDRHNLVQMKSMDQSYPVAYDTIDDIDDFFNYVDCYHPFISMSGDEPISSADAQLVLGTMGFYKGVDYLNKQMDDDMIESKNGIVDELLNNVSGSFRGGLICCLNSYAASNGGSAGYVKKFAFLSTRNNNFSNRSQKLQIVLTDSPDSTDKW